MSTNFGEKNTINCHFTSLLSRWHRNNKSSFLCSSAHAQELTDPRPSSIIQKFPELSKRHTQNWAYEKDGFRKEVQDQNWLQNFVQHGPQYVKIPIGIKVFQHKPLTPPCGLGLISIIDGQAHWCDCPLCDWPLWYTRVRVTSTKTCISPICSILPFICCSLDLETGVQRFESKTLHPAPLISFCVSRLDPNSKKDASRCLAGR